MSLSQPGIERTVAELQARLASDPDNLESLVGLAGALHQLGRSEELLDVIDHRAPSTSSAGTLVTGQLS